VEVDRQNITRLVTVTGAALTERQEKEILAQYGIPTTREALATSEEEAARLAQEFNYPVVLKVESAEITHKTEAGGVKLDIQNETELRRGYREILAKVAAYDAKAQVNGILIQEMMSGGKDVIVGMTRDGQFGPVIVVGLGGIFVDVIQDIAMRVAPLTMSDARDMIGELKGYRLLQGVRGEPASDIDALTEILCRFSRLSMDVAGKVAEIDINPLRVFEKGQGAVALDCLMTRRNKDEDRQA
ncbi:MAG: acetate--CoA ligase family protein, partial [Candidatus Binatia bacterium]